MARGQEFAVRAPKRFVSLRKNRMRASDAFPNGAGLRGPNSRGHGWNLELTERSEPAANPSGTGQI